MCYFTWPLCTWSEGSHGEVRHLKEAAELGSGWDSGSEGHALNCCPVWLSRGQSDEKREEGIDKGVLQQRRTTTHRPRDPSLQPCRSYLAVTFSLSSWWDSRQSLHRRWGKRQDLNVSERKARQEGSKRIQAGTWLAGSTRDSCESGVAFWYLPASVYWRHSGK